MAKRVAVILSGSGAVDGSEISEAVFTLLSLDRSGAEAVCAAPEPVMGAAARLTHGPIKPLAELAIDEVDGLIFPGGHGVATVLSNYEEKAQLCEIHPDVVRLLKAALGSHRPLGFIGLAPILAARVLGPVAGVRLTLPRGTPAAKHAAVMGADIRPCTPRDIFVDQKDRVVSTPGYLHEGIRIGEVASAVEKLTRTILHLARDRRPAPRPEPAARPTSPNVNRAPKGPSSESPPANAAPAARPGDPTRRRPPGAPVIPGRGSV